VILTFSPKRKDVMQGFHHVLEARERLGPEERSRFDDQIRHATDILQVAAGQHEMLAKLLIGAPDSIPKKTWRKKEELVERSRTHG